jgi:hypothetical protein
MHRALLFLPSILVFACASTSGGPIRQADGGYQLSCKGALRDCLAKAERICRDSGYTVSEARDLHELLGNESGQSTVMIQKSDATIYCGSSARASKPPISLKRAEPLEGPEAAPAPAATPPATAVAVRACVPGATQTCIGPAGCSGGQACAADGSRFEACDCGATSAPAASP